MLGARRRLAALAAVCLFAQGAQAAEPLRVVATIEPLCMLARELGGERVACAALVPAGASPHAFEPRPSALRAVADADLLLRAGNGVDDWAERLALAGERGWTVVGPRCARGDTACAHFWVDPGGAGAATLAIARELRALDPAGAPALAARAEGFARELAALEARMARERSRLRGGSFVSFHPAWAAFGARFGLVEIGAIQDHGAEEPTPRRLAELVGRAREAGVRAVLVESQLDPHTGRIVAEELGARVVTVDPLGDPRDPERATYLALVAWNARQLTSALAEERP